MRKLTAALCAAAMAVSMAVTALAAPSITTIAPETLAEVTTSVAIPEGKTVVVQAPVPASYKSKEAAEVVTKLNDDTTTITTAEILSVLKVDTTKEIKTESGTVIDPTAYEPITKFAELAITDGTTAEYSVDGKVVSVKATVTVEALKDLTKEDLKNIVLMQIDPETGEVYFIEISEDDFDPATGKITATFPCMGPFTVMEKAA
ncbi:MAG: hypothetical protein PHE06_06740 [Lachnospiraceae bacterium]|nr:hypothetical protein [Lachnospiraceae bacterium]